MKTFSIFVISIFLLSSCSTFFQAYKPTNVKTTPTQFSNNTDTVSIGKLPIKEYFLDKNLQSLVDIALANNQDLVIAQARIEQASAGLLLAKGLFLPSLGVSTSAGFDHFGDYTMNGVGNFDTNFSQNISKNQKINRDLTPDLFLGLRSQWEIGLWGKLKNNKKAAIKRFWASEQAKRLVTTDLVANIAMLYYSLVLLDDELMVIKQNVELQKEIVEIIESQKAGGRATELAVQQAEAQYLHTQSLEFVVSQKIVEAENHINFLLGRYPEAIVRSKDILNLPLPLTDKVGLPIQMINRRPDIKQAELALAASKADLLVAQARYLPSLNLDTYLGFNAFSAKMFFDPGSLVFGFVGGLFAPIFNRNEIRSNETYVRADVKAAYANYEKTLIFAFQEVKTQQAAANNLAKIYDLRKAENILLEKATSVANDLYKSGYANYLEVVFAQKSVLETKLTLLEVRKEQFDNKIFLYRALGGGWE